MAALTEPIQSCAGGWCRRREACANYHAATPDQVPSERLCAPGRDGELSITVLTPAQALQWPRLGMPKT